MDLKLLNNLWSCGHWSIKLLVDGLITFTYNICSNLFSNVEQLTYLWPMFSEAHKLSPNSYISITITNVQKSLSVFC